MRDVGAITKRLCHSCSNIVRGTCEMIVHTWSFGEVAVEDRLAYIDGCVETLNP